ADLRPRFSDLGLRQTRRKGRTGRRGGGRRGGGHARRAGLRWRGVPLGPAEHHTQGRVARGHLLHRPLRRDRQRLALRSPRRAASGPLPDAEAREARRPGGAAVVLARLVRAHRHRLSHPRGRHPSVILADPGLGMVQPRLLLQPVVLRARVHAHRARRYAAADGVVAATPEEEAERAGRRV
ncbi:MAG: hypothetical protein AVDCRST_MAG80-2519, partial [uncultured Rubrobacteraceae bacterium]